MTESPEARFLRMAQENYAPKPEAQPKEAQPEEPEGEEPEGKKEAPAEEPPEVPESESDPEETEETEDGEQPDGDEETEGEEEEDVHSQSEIDIDSIPEDERYGYAHDLFKALTPEDQRRLMQVAGSGAGKELAKFRKQDRESKERIKALESEISHLRDNVVPQNNPYGSVRDAKQLDEEEQNVSQSLAFYEQKLLEDGMETNDDGVEGLFLQGKFYPKSQLVKFYRELQTRKSAIPAQRERLRLMKTYDAQRKKAEQDVQSMAWYQDEESPERKEYDSIMSSPSVSTIQGIDPEFGAMLPKMVAHYVSGSRGVGGSGKLPLRRNGKPMGKQKGRTKRNEKSADREKRLRLEAARENISKGKFKPEDWAALREHTPIN